LLIGIVWYATRHRGDRTGAVGMVVVGVLIGVLSGAACTAARRVQGLPGRVEVQLPSTGVVCGASCVIRTLKLAA